MSDVVHLNQVPLGYVRFDTMNPQLSVQALMDSDRAQLAGRIGGWTSISRRRRVATTEWEGQDAHTMAVGIILDGYREDRSVQAEWDMLRQMGQKLEGQVQPPEVRVTGALPGTSVRWVIQDVEPGDARLNRSGILVRQFATVQLLEYNPATVVIRKSTDAQPGVPSHYTLHRARKGDTLAKLAKTYYGTASKWRTIGNAQTPRIRDPRRQIRVGRVLRIP